MILVGIALLFISAIYDLNILIIKCLNSKTVLKIKVDGILNKVYIKCAVIQQSV